jgi:hypothetical protein
MEFVSTDLTIGLTLWKFLISRVPLKAVFDIKSLV